MVLLIKKEKRNEMKTYYDLNPKEKREYLKEFKKTPGGFDCYLKNGLIQFVGIAFIFFITFWGLNGIEDNYTLSCLLHTNYLLINYSQLYHYHHSIQYS